MPFSSLIKLTTKCTNTNTEKNQIVQEGRKKMYVPGKDFVPHFYPGKVGEENTSKTEPLLSQGIWPSFFFFIPGRLWPKKKKERRKKSAKNLLLGRVLRIFVCLLLNCFWKQKTYFGRATLSWRVPLVIKLRDNVWGYSCFLKTCGIVRGREVFAVPHLLRVELQVEEEESLSCPQRGRGSSFFPACCYSRFWGFFSPFQFPVGRFAHKSTQHFFQTNGSRILYVKCPTLATRKTTFV